ncbi:MAG: TolC family protein [Myxococcales bacterium]|nr:TolC family protein [Myxococcales bacterium]
MLARTLPLLLASVAAVASPALAAPTSKPTSQPAAAKAAAKANAKPATPAAAADSVRRYTLDQLLALARARYPGVQAARHSLASMQQKLFRAKWAYAPQGKLQAFFAPSPTIECKDSQGRPSTDFCVQTPQVDGSSVNIGGIMAQVVLDVGLPIYTFGKIAAAKRAARAGVAVRRAQIKASMRDIELKVTKAYWALKLARELLYTIEQGRKHLDKGLQRIEKQLENDTGNATVIDKLRLKTAAAEVHVREAQAKKLERLMLATLATLCRIEGRFDVDKKIIDALPGKVAPVDSYLDLAKGSRPEMKLLDLAARAQRAAVDVERARFFPDLLLVGSVGVGTATGVDNPKNAFYNDPFNFVRAGFGLALRWQLDTVQQVGRYRGAKADAKRVEAKRREGLAGIKLEITKARLDLVEAKARLTAAYKGQKAARSWLVAVSQNMSAGLSEPKDLNDALIGFFQLKIRYLQAMFDVNSGWAALARAIGERVRPLK